MKSNELRDMTGADLETRANDLREEIFRLRFQTTTGQLENTSRLRVARREIARIMTILHEKKQIKEEKATEK